jgi:hypothetical protein
LNKWLCHLSFFVAVITTVTHATNSQPIFGDFNGDGIKDSAYFAKESIDAKWQLTVNFGSHDGVATIITLPEFTPDVPLDEIMIYTESPSVFPTACYQMPEDCTPELPEQIEMINDGIIVAVLNDAAVLLHWDETSGRFLRHRIID